MFTSNGKIAVESAFFKLPITDSLKDEADKGVITACLDVGTEFLLGLHRPKDIALGLKYIGIAAEAGHAAACLCLAEHYWGEYRLSGKEHDKELVLKYIQLGLDNKNNTTYDKGYYQQKEPVRLIEALQRVIGRSQPNSSSLYSI